MKRYFLIAVETEGSELSPLTLNTDDVKASVESLFRAGYDILTYDVNEDGTDADVDYIVAKLLETKEWPAEDGARALILIDTQDETIGDTVTQGGE